MPLLEVDACVIQVHLCEAFHLSRYLRDSGAISTLSRSPRSTVVLVKTLRHGADDVARSVVTHGFGFGYRNNTSRSAPTTIHFRFLFY